jgi:hypothetical protein
MSCGEITAVPVSFAYISFSEKLNISNRRKILAIQWTEDFVIIICRNDA